MIIDIIIMYIQLPKSISTFEALDTKTTQSELSSGQRRRIEFTFRDLSIYTQDM